MWVLSLGWEDPLEEGMATHSSILALRIPWTEEPGGIQSTGLQGVRHARAVGHPRGLGTPGLRTRLTKMTIMIWVIYV